MKCHKCHHIDIAPMNKEAKVLYELLYDSVSHVSNLINNVNHNLVGHFVYITSIHYGH